MSAGEATIIGSECHHLEATCEVRLLCVMPSIPLGGMERAVVRIVEHLVASGAEAHFVLDEHWGIPVQHHVERIGVGWTGVPFVSKIGMPDTFLELGWSLRSLARSYSDIASVARRFRPRHLLATSINNAYFARSIARSPDIFSVFRLPNPPGLSANPVKRALDRRIWQTVYRAFDVVVCNSHYTAGRLAEMVKDDRRIRVIRNFPPQINRTSESDAPRIDSARKTVVYVGQVSRNKGVGLLVDAAMDIVSRRTDTDFVIAGPEPWMDLFGEQERKRVSDRGLADRIRFVGSIQDVHGLLAQAAINVCPSISADESFPNVVIEAKQAGTPSIVSPTAGLPEAVEHGQDGLITSDCSSAALVLAIERLLDEPQLRAHLAEGARRSLGAFSNPNITRDWLELLEGKS